MDLWVAATLVVLSFLGILLISILSAFVWLAYRYDISFSIRSKDSLDENPGGDWSESSTWGVKQDSQDLPYKIERGN